MAVEEVKTSRELGFGEPKVGYEADMGNTPPGDPNPGHWTVRRETDSWALIFHSFVAYPVSGFYKKGFDPGPGPDYIIATFLPTEEGERAVKKMALRLVDMAWGRDEGGEKDHA